ETEFVPARTLEPTGVVTDGQPIERLLREMGQRGATDLFLVSDAPPVLRLNGRLTSLDSTPLSSEDVDNLLMPLLSSRVRETMQNEGAADFSIRVSPGEEQPRSWRFRVNVH